jgi:hypothetical protein
MTRHVQRRHVSVTDQLPDFPPTPMHEVLGNDVPLGLTNCGWCASGHCKPTETSRGCINVQQRAVKPTHRCPHQCAQGA